VIFLGKSEYFTGRGLKGLISRAFFTGVGVIPLDRGGGEASERAIRTSLRVLASGNVLGIYPEGTRSPDGRLYRGKTGVARLAIESGAPVVPCAMIDTFQLQPPGRLWPDMRVRPGVRFGEPLDFSRYHGQEADAKLLRTITDEIMQAIAKLSGQEYVDVDARRAKAELAADDPGGLFAARRARCSVRAVLVAMILPAAAPFSLVPAAEWVCHVHAACPVAGAGSADRCGGRGDVRFPEDGTAAGGGDPGPAWPVAGR
jgi:1-acyl-sn-glycerol-3-phosphate acyltransferase